MIEIEGLLSIFSGFNTVHESYKRISGMLRGNKDESLQYMERMCQGVEGLSATFEKLSEKIVYAPDMQAVLDTTQTTQQKIEDLREVREYLEPVQQALDEDILSSAMIFTPERMQEALNKSPWEVLMDVRPVNLASKPTNPDLLPILFEHSGMQYVGWQMRGSLPMLFNCEFDELWVPDVKVNGVVDLGEALSTQEFEVDVPDNAPLPVSESEVVVPIIETPASYPSKPDFKTIFEAERDPFEYPQEFLARYQTVINQFNLAVSQHQTTYQAGVAVLDKSGYDIHSGHFPVHIKLNDWTQRLGTLFLNDGIQVARDDAKKLWQEGKEKSVFYVLQNVEGEAQVKQVFLVGLNQRWKLFDVEGRPGRFSKPARSVGDVFQDKLKDGSLGAKMVVVPAGEFMMGSNAYDTEKPIHKVTIAKPFAIGKYQVTFEEYDKYCEATGTSKSTDQGWGRGKRPVINVSWEDVQEYCQWLSEQTGQDYRLPTEAQWEYACRAGSTTKWSFGNDENRLKDYAWYTDNSGSKTHPVGEKKPNAWGLYDMHGNVLEWCEDSWHNRVVSRNLRWYFAKRRI